MFPIENDLIALWLGKKIKICCYSVFFNLLQNTEALKQKETLGRDLIWNTFSVLS